MSSYLVPASQSFIPTQLYQPDFESIGGILRTKQMQYDQGFNQLKSTFNSILNAPLTVDENKVVRQQYIDQARDQLKNLPKADLSIQQVQSQAQEVFNPFYEDQDIVKDMVKTKQFTQQFQFAENLRNSKKPEEQAQYWDMGVQYLNNGLEKLRTAKRGDGSIDKVEARRYVSYFDSQKFLDEEAKAEGLKIERESSNGQYKLTRINGDEAVPLFETWASSKLSGNNKANDMFRVEGTVLYENQLSNLINNGVPIELAKSTLANNYIQKQADRYKQTVDKLTAYGKTLKTDIEAQRVLVGQVPSAENLQKLEGLLKQFQANEENIPKYQDFATKFGDKESKDYKDVYNSLMNNGEAFFAEHSRENFIDNWAKGRAANSSVKYEIDPGFKLNMELEKEVARMKSQEAMNDARITKIVDGISYATGGSGGSSGSGGKTASQAKLDALNTPVPVGLNVGGKDTVSVFNRFVEAKKQSLDTYINSGLKFIEQMGFNYASGDLKGISNNYLTQLKDQITRNDGQFVPNEAAQKEHKELQDAGIIPKDIPFGGGPVRTFNAIKNYYSNVFVKQLKEGVAKPEIIKLLDDEEYNSKKYAELKSIEDKELANLKTDPSLKEIFKGDNIISYNEYLKTKGADISEKSIQANYQVYLNSKRLTPGSNEVNVMGYDEYKKQIIKTAEAQFKSEYENKINTFKNKFGKTSISKGDEAYIGPGVQFEAGDKDDETVAKKITSIVMADENFTEQNITKDGIVPTNISQLEELGADRKEIAGFLGRIQSNARDLISRIGVTKIGSDGKPTVKLYFKQSTIDDYSKDGKNQVISTKTANALGKGIEITVNNPELLKSQGLNLDFTPSSIDQLTLRKEGIVEAPKVLKQAGFDYSISPSIDGQSLLVKFNYKLFKNGNFEQPQFTTYEVPIAGSSIDDIRTKLFNTAMQIYNSNYQNSSQYFKQNPQIDGDQVSELLKKYNYK